MIDLKESVQTLCLMVGQLMTHGNDKGEAMWPGRIIQRRFPADDIRERCWIYLKTWAWIFGYWREPLSFPIIDPIREALLTNSNEGRPMKDLLTLSEVSTFWRFPSQPFTSWHVSGDCRDTRSENTGGLFGKKLNRGCKMPEVKNPSELYRKMVDGIGSALINPLHIHPCGCVTRMHTWRSLIRPPGRQSHTALSASPAVHVANPILLRNSSYIS